MAKKQKGKVNPVAKYAGQFNHAKVFRDRTKYKRLNKGAQRKSLLPFLLPFYTVSEFVIYEVKS